MIRIRRDPVIGEKTTLESGSKNTSEIRRHQLGCQYRRGSAETLLLGVWNFFVLLFQPKIVK